MKLVVARSESLPVQLHLSVVSRSRRSQSRLPSSQSQVVQLKTSQAKLSSVDWYVRSVIHVIIKLKLTSFSHSTSTKPRSRYVDKEAFDLWIFPRHSAVICSIRALSRTLGKDTEICARRQDWRSKGVDVGEDVSKYTMPR